MVAGNKNLRLGQRALTAVGARGPITRGVGLMLAVACLLMFASTIPASASPSTAASRAAAAARARIARAKLARRPSVTSVAASARDDGNHVTWLAARTRVSGYRVFRARSSTGPYAAIATVKASTTRFIDRTTPALPDTSYYKVAALAVSTKAEGPRSAAVKATWGLAPPTGLVARAGDLENRLSWDAAAQKRIAGLAVLRSPAGTDAFVKVADLGTAARSYDDPIPVDQLGVYEYKVAAVSPSGRGFDSGVATADIVEIASPVTPLSATAIIASTGELELFVPAGAVAAPTTLTINTRGPADALTAVDQGMTGAYSFGPDGTVFTGGAYPRLTLRYRGFPQGEIFEAEWVAQTAKLYVFDTAAAAWAAVSSGLAVDTTADTVSSDISHFTDYAAGFTVMPHGRIAPTSNLCVTCHGLHSATGESLARRENVDLCYYCHGAPGSTQTAMGAHGPNIRASFFASSDQTATGNSTHPVPDRKTFCVDCHTPHYDPTDYPKLLYYWAPLSEGSISLARWYNVKPGITGTRRVELVAGSGQGNKTCFGCHGTSRNPRIRQGAGLPETGGDNYYARTKGDHSDDYTGGHAATSLAYSPPAGADDATCGITRTSTEVQCKACHADHGQEGRQKLIRASVNGTSVTGNDVTLCLACHVSASGRYEGSALYTQTAHSTVTASTKALVRWPGTATASSAGECKNCHDPHGTPNGDYARAAGNGLCYTCHDDASTTKPNTYSYQGNGDFSGSAHSAMSGSVGSATFRMDSTGSAAWQSVTTPTPSSPGSPMSDPQKAAMLTADSTRGVTNLTHANGGYDHQMYRFKLSVPTTSVTQMALDWAGFGEEIAGYPVSVYVWNYSYNAGAGGWELIQSAQMANQTRVQAVETTSTHVDGSGYVYVMAKARNVVDSTILSGPSVTNITTGGATVSWTTLGKADQWVDYGLTAGYGSLAGSATTGTAHTVNLALAGQGLYHYRVRSTDRDGEATATADATFQALGMTTLTGQADASGPAPIPVTLQWSAVSCPDGDPSQYYVEYSDGVTTYNSGWISPSSFATSLPQGTWSWRVRVRDAVHASSLSGWTGYDVFVLNDSRAPAAPTPANLGDYYYDSGYEPAPTVVMTWTPVLAGDGDPVEYYAELWAWGPGPPGTFIAATGWTAGTTWTAQLGAATYYWHVRARDASHTGSLGSWSGWDAFNVYDTWSPPSSCPELFAKSGAGVRFVTDVLGLGALEVKQDDGGNRYSPGLEESSIDPSLLEAADGHYELRIKDEKNEIEYMDEVKLKVVDHPAGTEIYLNDLYKSTSATYAYEPTIFTVRDPVALSAATYDNIPVFRGPTVSDLDIASELAERDHDYAPAYIYDENRYTMDLGELSGAARIKLVMTGWTEYPTAEEKAAWKAQGATGRAPRGLDVMDAQGQWVEVMRDLDTIPGYTKTVIYDLTGKFPDGIDTWKVRIRSGARTHIDQVLVDTSPEEPVTVTELGAVSADLQETGVDLFGRDPEPHYIYGTPRTPIFRHTGNFTRLGDVQPLLSARDDMFVIMDTGDELALRFEEAPAPAPGLVRTYVIRTAGYFNGKSGKVDPLPFQAMSKFPYVAPEHYPDDPEHAAYLEEWNTRVRVAGSAGSAPRALDILAQLGVATDAGGEGPPLASAEAADPSADVHRSLNTDYVRLDVDYAQAQGPGGCENCHAVHGAPASGGQPFKGLLSRQEGSLCTGNGSGCHALVSDSFSGVNIYGRFSASGNDTAHHDVLPAAQQATGARTSCSDCHNPHTETSSTPYSRPATIGETMTPGRQYYADADGYVYALIGARHDGIAPVISNLVIAADTSTSVVITWSTDESATTWVDWGTTSTPYPNSNGSASLAKSHSVQLSGLATGTVYHWRARTADALGNERTTPDATMTPLDPPPAPTLGDTGEYYYDSSVQSPPSVVMTWTPVLAGDGDPAQYYSEVWAWGGPGVGYLEYSSGWMSSTSWVLDLPGTITYYRRVKARDAVHPWAVSDWSTWDVFGVTDVWEPGGSCPFLFTWDGRGYAFEADNFTAGRIGGPTAVGYQQPNPNDAYVLKVPPAAKDGRWSFNLVEERPEVDYLDSYRLYTVDAPAGATVYAEKAVAGKRTFPPLPSALHTVRSLRAPLSATRTDTGEDVLAAASNDDGTFVELNENAETDFTYKTIELDLGSDVVTAPQVKVVMDALTEFPVTPAGIARRFTFGLPSKLEVQDAGGTWRSVPTTVGSVPVPPEFVRPYVFDLTSAVKDTTGKVRFTYLFRTLIDHIGIDTTADESLTITQATLADAELRYHGVDEETGTAEVKRFVYGEDLTGGSHYPGSYTRFGDVTGLLGATDDKFVIMGQGDEIALSFEPPAAAATDASRFYVFSAYGYYKDRKTDLPKMVEPLPFAAMSNYPYPASEHYPDDAEHVQYQAEYNTRVYDQPYASRPPAPAGTTLAKAAPGAPRADLGMLLASTGAHESAGADAHYSVNTDIFALGSTSTTQAVSWYLPLAGWQAEGPSAPVPTALGASVDASTLARASSQNGVHWITDLTATDGRWNWQVVKFRVPPASLPTVARLQPAWYGHGEPTPAYPTTLYLWNRHTASWEQMQSLNGAGSDVWLSKQVTINSISNDFCLACHGAAPPPNVYFPTPLVNVSSSWASGDRHGASAGGGWSSSLRTPYVRGQDAIPCETCHDPHGNANLYHIQTSVNATTVSAPDNPSVKNLCLACHVGPVDTIHAQCISCHVGDGDEHGSPPSSFEGSWCLSCHSHGAAWGHYDPGCHGCGDPYWYGSPSF